ncbi:MAG: putative metal-binding motif-containing protein [Archangium sp.]
MFRAWPVVFCFFIACVTPPPSPTFNAVVPSELVAEAGGTIEMKGDGFLPVGVFDFDKPASSPWQAPVAAQATNGSVTVLLSEVKWVDGKTVKAMVPPGLPPGLWSIELTIPRGEMLKLADALTLTVPAEFDAGVVVACDVTTLQDSDGDSFGLDGTEAMLCGPGRVDAGGDCNDFDALTHPGGTEVCNGLDDDCDGVRDDGVCGGDGGAGFTRIRTLDANDNDFVAVSAFGPDSVWIAGGDKLFLYLPDAGFSDRSNNCPSRMNAVWADPATGRAFVAGGNPGIGRIAIANRMGTGCQGSVMIPDPVVGISGFVGVDGGVAVELLMRDGRRVTWDGVGATQVVGTNQGLTLSTGSISARSTFYGAGRNSANVPVVLRVRDDGRQTFDNLQMLGSGLPTFRGSSSSSMFDLALVGDQGFVATRFAGTWMKPAADAGTDDFYAVKAFAPGRFYVSGARGQVRLWNGTWTVFPTDVQPVRAMDGVDEEHLWLVGDNGFILRRP